MHIWALNGTFVVVSSESDRVSDVSLAAPKLGIPAHMSDIEMELKNVNLI